MKGAFRTGFLGLGLLAAAGVVQARLERRPERIAQRSLDQVQGLPKGKVLVQYIGMLFLGGFKPLVINTLWINYQNAAKDRQWFEAREVMEVLSQLQPYNEEVWVHLSWDLAYNLAQEADSDLERCQFIREGIRFARQGALRNPKSPYLSWWSGFMFYHRSLFVESFSLRLEKETGRSAYLEAIDCFRESIDRAGPGTKYVPTGGGYIWTPQDSDAQIRSCYFLHGVVNALARGDYAEAKESVGRAAEQNRRMMEKYRGQITERWPKELERFYIRVPEVLDLEKALVDAQRRPKEVPVEERLARLMRVLRAYADLLVEFPGADDRRLERRFLWIGHANGMDEFEPNPKAEPTPVGGGGREEDLSLGPLWDDEDWFAVMGVHGFELEVTPAGGWSPKVEILAVEKGQERPLGEAAPAPGGTTLRFETKELNEQSYRVRVYDPAAAEGAPVRRYHLAIRVE